MGTREKILNENNVHFIYGEFAFFCTRSELKYHENFHARSYDTLLFVLETECYCSHLQNQFAPGRYKNLRQLLNIKGALSGLRQFLAAESPLK